MNQIENSNRPKSRAQRRADAAGRTRKWRRQRQQSGAPEARDVDRAISESIAFLGRVVVSTLDSAPQIDVAALFRVAVVVLVRDGYDRELSRRAVRQRMDVRDEHGSASYVPSSNPNPARVTIQPRKGQQFKPADIEFIQDLVTSHSDGEPVLPSRLPRHTA